jgi:hypothetical protein
MSRASGVRFKRELAAAVHPRSLRELISGGVTMGQLRGKGWRRTSHGFYVPASCPSTATQRILEAVPLSGEELAAIEDGLTARWQIS